MEWPRTSRNPTRDWNCRIRERTAEVEDKARRLYEYSRDMATISRLSTKVFNAEQTLDEMLDRFMWSVSPRVGTAEIAALPGRPETGQAGSKAGFRAGRLP